MSNGIFDDLVKLGGSNPSYMAPSQSSSPMTGMVDNHLIPPSLSVHSNAPMALIPQDHEHKLDIRSMMFVETNGHDDIFHRCHTARVEHDTMRVLEEVTQRGFNLESNVLAPLAGKLIEPSAIPTPNAINLPGGIRNRRLRFMLTLFIGGKLSNKTRTQYVFGYCEFLDYGKLVSGKTTLPAEMKMFFNHTITIENGNSNNGLANMSINDNSQYLMGSFNLDMVNQDLIPSTMRPSDVMRRLQAIESGFSSDADVLDSRQSFGFGAVVKNNRSNNNSSDYLARSLKALDSAVTTADSNDLFNANAIHKRAAGAVPESTINEDVFMNALSKTTSIRETGYVTWGNLCNLALCNLDGISTLRTLGDAQKRANQMHYNGAMHNYSPYSPGNALPWTSRTIGAQIAARISQQLPGIMLFSALGQVEFLSTNKTIDGRWATQVITPNLLSFINGGCPPSLLNRFINKLEQDILTAVAYGTAVEVNVFASMDCDARIFIKVGDMDMEYYVCPLYCDHINSPVWSGNSLNVEKMAIGINSIYNTITRNVDTRHQFNDGFL